MNTNIKKKRLHSRSGIVINEMIANIIKKKIVGILFENKC